MAERLIDRNRVRKPLQDFHVSGDAMKWLGFILMCLGTIASTVIQRGVMKMDTLTEEELVSAGLQGWAVARSMLLLFSVMAIPIQVRLFYEGWNQTSDRKRYLLRLAGLALVSEIPYDWALSGKLLDISVQNPVWALIIGGVMLAIFEEYSQRGAGGTVMKVSAVIGAAMWVMLLQSYMGMVTLALILCVHLLSGRKGWCTLVGSFICLIQLTAPIGMFFVHFYDGSKPKTNKWVFYVLYPAHLLVLAILTALL